MLDDTHSNDSNEETDMIDLENDDDSEPDDDILEIIESITYDPEESGVDDVDAGDDQAYYDTDDDEIDDLLDDGTAGIDDRFDDDVVSNDDYYDDDENTEGSEEGLEGSASEDSSDEGETTSLFSPASILKDTSKDALGSIVMGALVFVMIALSIMAIRRVNWRRQVRYHQTETLDEQNHELYLDTEMQAPRTVD